MAVISEADWGRYQERSDEHEKQLGDHETRIRGLELKVTSALAKVGVLVFLITLAAALAGSYIGAHGFH